jgi:hypothetical protein
MADEGQPRKMAKPARRRRTGPSSAGAPLAPIGEAAPLRADAPPAAAAAAAAGRSGKRERTQRRRRSILEAGGPMVSTGGVGHAGETAGGGGGGDGSPMILPECLQTDFGGVAALMLRSPQSAGSVPGKRSGAALWADLRDTLRDRTTRSWLGLTCGQDANVDNAHSNQEKRNKLREAEARKEGMILPNSKFHQWWDFAQIVLLSYIAIMVPFRIGFDANAMPWEFLFLFDAAVDAYFIIDIYVNFKTCIRTKTGDLVVDKRVVAR